MSMISNSARMRALFAVAVFLNLLIHGAVWANENDSAEAFMSATFGLSAARAQRRMENSGAVAMDFLRDGRLTMKGTFERRSAIFILGFHDRRGLNHKSVYLASSGDANLDRALYEAFREAYNIRFGRTDERVVPSVRDRRQMTFQSSWNPNRDTNISLSYYPEHTSRFPGDSPSGRPIRLIYNFTGWTR